jgi:hypothetical protein
MKTTYKCRYQFIAKSGQMFFVGDSIDYYDFDRLETYEQLNFKQITL